jgi:homocysteine S-methyltransferase
VTYVFETMLAAGGPILTEGSVYELLRRDPEIVFDPEIAHAGLVYDERFRARLADVHLRYLAIARDKGLPLVVLADTWRASEERIARSRFAGRPVNEDNVRFMRELRDAAGEGAPPVAIAGLTGPRGDAYQPAEAPTRDEARRVHALQVEALARGGADVLYAATLPAVDEAHGIAELMATTGVPYLVSFVVRPGGTVLDGTPLADAIRRLDDGLARPPAGFSINCVHPTVFASAMAALESVDPGLVERVIWFQANTSPLSPEELDGSETLEEGDPGAYASELVAACGRFRTRVVGGCCGSDVRHLDGVASKLGPKRRDA